MPAIPCPRHPDGATDLTPPEEHVLHDVGLCRDDSEVSKAWRGHRVPVPMISQVESSFTFETKFGGRRKTPETWTT